MTSRTSAICIVHLKECFVANFWFMCLLGCTVIACCFKVAYQFVNDRGNTRTSQIGLHRCTTDVYFRFEVVYALRGRNAVIACVFGQNIFSRQCEETELADISNIGRSLGTSLSIFSNSFVVYVPSREGPT